MVTQIIHFVGGEKEHLTILYQNHYYKDKFTKFQQTDGTWVMVNDKNILCIEVFKEK